MTKKAGQRVKKRTSQSGTLPLGTILSKELFHDLRNEAEVSCDRTRDLLRQLPDDEKSKALLRELRAWKYRVYWLVRNSLREHIRFVTAAHPEAPIAVVWRWSQDQASVAISRALGYGQAKVALQDLGGHQNPHWLRECSDDWVKMACEPDMESMNPLRLGSDWHAPEWWTYHMGGTIQADKAAHELLSTAACELRDALNDAKYDAFAWLWLNLRPHFTSKTKEAIFKYLSVNGSASAKEVASYLDSEGIGCRWDKNGWVAAFAHHEPDINSLVSKVRTHVK